MAADPNIFAQYLQPVRSMNERLAALDQREMAGLQLQGQRRQNAFMEQQQAAQMDAMDQTRQDRNEFARLAQATGGDQNALIRALEGSGRQNLLKMSQDIRKAAAEAAAKEAGTAKTNAEADKERLTMAKTRGEMILQAVSAAKDPASYAQARAWLGSQGIDVAGIPEQFDPQYVATAGQQAMTVVQRADQEMKAKGYQLDVEKFGETKRSNLSRESEDARANRAREGLTARGQNMTDSRAREGLDLQRAAQAKAAADGKPLTEGQAKAVAFAARMASANQTLAELAKAGREVSTPGSRAGFGVGNVVNVLNTSAGQQLDQAKRDFVNAVLRRESGAVIADSEFNNADKQYFPQVGDSKEVIEQKARNRAVAIEGMKADIPKGFQPEFERIVKLGSKPADGATPAAPSGQPARVTSDADYNALPSGAMFVGPDGKTRRKP